MRLLSTEKVITLKPDDAVAYYSLGKHMRGPGNCRRRYRYQSALRYRPEHPEAHNNLATVLRRLGRLEKLASTMIWRFSIGPIIPRRSATSRPWPNLRMCQRYRKSHASARARVPGMQTPQPRRRDDRWSTARKGVTLFRQSRLRSVTWVPDWRGALSFHRKLLAHEENVKLPTLMNQPVVRRARGVRRFVLCWSGPCSAVPWHRR